MRTHSPLTTSAEPPSRVQKAPRGALHLRHRNDAGVGTPRQAPVPDTDSKLLVTAQPHLFHPSQKAGGGCLESQFIYLKPVFQILQRRGDQMQQDQRQKTKSLKILQSCNRDSNRPAMGVKTTLGKDARQGFSLEPPPWLDHRGLSWSPAWSYRPKPCPAASA